MNRLYASFLKSMEGSAWKEGPQRFEINFLSEIVALKREIQTRTYKKSPGTEFLLCERGKVRHAHGSDIRDRIVQHNLCDNILAPALKPYLIYNNGASQKGKGVAFSRKMFERDLHNYWLEYHTNDGYVGFVDFRKYYDNIRHDKVRELIFPKISESAAWLLDEILKTFEIDVSYMSAEEYAGCMDVVFDSVKYHETVPEELRTGEKYMQKSVNIGDQVSQDIGVIHPSSIDNYAKIVRGCKRYGRYADDSYIIERTREEVQSVIDGITEQAEKIGIFVNQKKTHIAKLSDTYKYLQVKYTLSDTGKVIKRVNPESVTRERRRLKAYKRLLERGEMDYENIEQAYKSWMGTYAHIMSKAQTKNMKQLYKELFGKEPRWKK